MGEINFEIKRHIGVLAQYSTGWTKELNVISWNGNPEKYDIRDWDPDHARMTRGITLHPEEAEALMNALIKEFDA